MSFANVFENSINSLRVLSEKADFFCMKLRFDLNRKLKRKYVSKYKVSGTFIWIPTEIWKIDF